MFFFFHFFDFRYFLPKIFGSDIFGFKTQMGGRLSGPFNKLIPEV